MSKLRLKQTTPQYQGIDGMVTKENIIEFYEKYIRKHEDATK